MSHEERIIELENQLATVKKTRIRELESKRILAHKIICCVVAGDLESAKKLLVDYQKPDGQE